MLATAAKLFAANGYARTTLAKIAAEAGVSAETVQGQGPKAALLMAAIDHVAFGVTGEENVLNLEVGRELVAIDDYEKAVDSSLRPSPVCTNARRRWRLRCSAAPVSIPSWTNT